MKSTNGSRNTGLNPMPQPSHSEIARLAAQLWETNGRPNGRDEEFWIEAERKILSDRDLSQPKAEHLAKPKSAARTKPKDRLAASDPL